MLRMERVYKAFGQTEALQEVSLQIPKGQIFGLLGPNGAGKTTLIRCLLGIIRPQAGRFVYKGRPLKEESIHAEFGFLPENFCPYGNLTGLEFLNILGQGLSLKGDGLNSLMEEMGLSSHKHRRIRTYSRGLIQRLGLAMSLLGGKELLILDEPTLGLDPIGQRQILELLLKLKEQGKTIFFSSHLLSQVERVCDQIGIIHKGRLLFSGHIRELLDETGTSNLEEAFLSKVSGEKGGE